MNEKEALGYHNEGPEYVTGQINTGKLELQKKSS